MKTLTSLGLLSLSLSFAVGACAVKATDSNTASSGAAVSSSKLVGTWVDNGADALLYYSFTFHSDHTYAAMGGCNPNAGLTCFAITESQGTWTLDKSGPELGAPAGADQLVLDDQLGNETAYFYSLSGETLSLSTTLVGSPSNFVKQSDNPPPPSQTACEQAGGSCVALAPGSCTNGSVGGYSCGSGLGLECCMPGSGNDAGPGSGNDAGPSGNDAGPGNDAAPGNDASAQQCQVNSDCTGFLPQSCEVCSNGSTGCAQWTCQAGQCEITYCD
jgi:hypothetical protein